LRHFKHFVDLPEGLDEEEISSALDKNGCLMVTAPYLASQAADEKQKQVQVQQETAKKGPRHLLLRQDSKIEKSWNRIFDDFFCPVFESSGLFKNQDLFSDSTALTKHRSEVSKTMNDAIAKRFNFQQESRLDHWDQVFDEFFFPMFESNRFFKTRSLFSAGDHKAVAETFV